MPRPTPTTHEQQVICQVYRLTNSIRATARQLRHTPRTTRSVLIAHGLIDAAAPEIPDSNGENPEPEPKARPSRKANPLQPIVLAPVLKAGELMVFNENLFQRKAWELAARSQASREAVEHLLQGHLAVPEPDLAAIGNLARTAQSLSVAHAVLVDKALLVSGRATTIHAKADELLPPPEVADFVVRQVLANVIEQRALPVANGEEKVSG